jgi:hypothetical protein
MDDKTLRQLRILGDDIGALWMDAASVVWMRSLRIAQGGAGAAAEAELMVGEKIVAQQELWGKLATGKLGENPLAVTINTTRHLRNRVRANRRRLAGG